MDKFAKLNQNFSEQAVPAVAIDAQVHLPLQATDIFLSTYKPETVEIEVDYGSLKTLTFHTYQPMAVKHMIIDAAINLGQDLGKYYCHVNGMIMFLQYYLKDSQIILRDVGSYTKTERMSIFDFFVTSKLVSKIEEQCPFLFFELEFINNSIVDRHNEFLQKANTAKEIVDHMFYKLGEGIVDLANSFEGLEKKNGAVSKLFKNLVH